jgi:hypothetical protein
VTEGELLIIDLEATDEDADTLLYATNAHEVLPSEYSFDQQSGIFRWVPDWDDAGIYEVEFSVTDGYLWDADTTTLTVLDDPSALVEIRATDGIQLRQPFPSPTLAGTNVCFYAPEPTSIDLSIFDARGRLVKALANETSQPSGWSAIWWDGRDQAGERVPSGIYFCILEAGKERLVKDVALVR